MILPDELESLTLDSRSSWPDSDQARRQRHQQIEDRDDSQLETLLDPSGDAQLSTPQVSDELVPATLKSQDTAADAAEVMPSLGSVPASAPGSRWCHNLLRHYPHFHYPHLP